MRPACARHAFVHNPADAVGGTSSVRFQRDADAVIDGVRGCVHVNLKLSLGKSFGPNVAQGHIRIGDGRLATAAAEGNRTGLGSRALRSHRQTTQPVHRGNRSAARANLDHFNCRDAHRHARSFDKAHGAPNLELARGLRRRFVNEAKFCRGAAHVERKNFLQSRIARNPRRQYCAPGGTRFHQANRKACRGGKSGHASARRHHQDVARQSFVSKGLRKAFKVTRHQRLHISIGDRGAQTVELAGFRTHLRTQRDYQLRTLYLQETAQALLVRGVCIGVKQTNRHRLGLRGIKFGNQFVDTGFVQRNQHLARNRHAFRHGKSALPGHQVIRLGQVNVILAVASLIRNFENVAEPFGGDCCNPRTAPFEKRIRRKRRAVHKAGDFTRYSSRLFQGPAHTGQRARSGILMRG